MLRTMPRLVTSFYFITDRCLTGRVLDLPKLKPLTCAGSVTMDAKMKPAERLSPNGAEFKCLIDFTELPSHRPIRLATSPLSTTREAIKRPARQWRPRKFRTPATPEVDLDC
jgi:hypothetical protein